MESIKVLVVVYNKKLSECPIIDSVKGLKGIELYVADNSTHDMGNKAMADALGCRYFDMGGNKGLSKAYNAVIDSIERKDGIICLFDDDTQAPKEYFDLLRERAKTDSETDVFAPVVIDADGILSPCILMNRLKGIRITDLSKLPSKGLSVINSGLAVRLKVFADYRFDEGLFLDYIDHAFIRDIISQEKSKIGILDVVLKQRFSGSEAHDKNTAAKRLHIYLKDARFYAKKYRISCFKVWWLIIKRNIKVLLMN